MEKREGFRGEKKKNRSAGKRTRYRSLRRDREDLGKRKAKGRKGERYPTGRLPGFTSTEGGRVKENSVRRSIIRGRLKERCLGEGTRELGRGLRKSPELAFSRSPGSKTLLTKGTGGGILSLRAQGRLAYQTSSTANHLRRESNESDRPEIEILNRPEQREHAQALFYFSQTPGRENKTSGTSRPLRQGSGAARKLKLSL